jgi:hypothetical protein
MEERPAEEPDVILVSTRTVDRLPLADGAYQELPGGPATYVGHALEELGVRYTLVTGVEAVTEVVRTEDGDQHYIIPALPPIPLPQRLTARATILSPIMQEIDPVTLPSVTGLLVIDLQGFVREPGRHTGSSSKQFDLVPLLARADVVKGGPDELARLTAQSRQVLGDRLLLETEGARGVWLRRKGRSVLVPARRVQAAHTIGAGDIFLGAFVHGLLEGRGEERAAEEAARFTEEMLRKRARGG